MAPPIMEKTDPATGRPQKREFGPWMYRALNVLAKFKFLRGTPFDIFGYHKDRREERALIAEYEGLVDTVLKNLSPENFDICVQILSLPDMIRGFGPVKERNIELAHKRKEELLAQLTDGHPVRTKKAA